MKIAAASYPIDWLESWSEYENKIEHWVATAEADLLVFPEYGTMELASLEGEKRAADLHASIATISGYAAAISELHQRLAEKYHCAILGASMPLEMGQKLPVNRAYLYRPNQTPVFQDKQIMTRFERETWHIGAGDPLRVFEWQGIKIGVLICYDVEFPLLARRLVEQGVQLILAPSCTDSLAGYNRVRIGAMARALEGQCIVMQAPTVGTADWSPAVDINIGAAGIFAPPDLGFPDSGIVAIGEMNVPSWVRAEVDFAKVDAVRSGGHVLNYQHWDEQ